MANSRYFLQFPRNPNFLSVQGDFAPVIVESNQIKHAEELTESGRINLSIMDCLTGELSILDALSKRTIKRFHIPRGIYNMKLMSANYVSYPEKYSANSSMVYFKRSPLQNSFLILYESNGNFKFVDFFKGELIKSFVTGCSLVDFVFSQTRYQRTFKSPFRPNLDTLYLAGKGIHVWDLQKNQKVRTMAYNQYSKYLKVIEFSEGSEHSDNRKKLLISVGHLHDPIIKFLYDIFVEIWNPETGGCVKRFTNTHVELDPSWNVGVNLSLVRISNMSEDKNDGQKVLVLTTPQNIQIWDVQNSERPLWEVQGSYDPGTIHSVQNESEFELRVIELNKPRELWVWKLNKIIEILQE